MKTYNLTFKTKERKENGNHGSCIQYGFSDRIIDVCLFQHRWS
jgi:hypothetical protein